MEKKKKEKWWMCFSFFSREYDPQWELFPFNFCLKVDRCAYRDAWSDARLEGYALSDSRFYQHQVKMRDEPVSFSTRRAHVSFSTREELINDDR